MYVWLDVLLHFEAEPVVSNLSLWVNQKLEALVSIINQFVVSQKCFENFNKAAYSANNPPVLVSLLLLPVQVCDCESSQRSHWSGCLSHIPAAAVMRSLFSTTDQLEHKLGTLTLPVCDLHFSLSQNSLFFFAQKVVCLSLGSRTLLFLLSAAAIYSSFHLKVMDIRLRIRTKCPLTGSRHVDWIWF